MLGALASWLFDPTGLTPHGFCLLWEPGLLWLHAVSDVGIGLAYFTIPFALIAFIRHRPDLVFRPVFGLFAAFILLCGAGHWLDLLTLWVPAYGIEGLVKAATAVTSILTAIALWKLMPQALALPSPAQLRKVNLDLFEAKRAELIRDITTRKYVQTAERFQRVVEAAPNAMVMIRASGQIEMVNAQAEQVFGHSRTELLGQSVELLVPERFRGHHSTLRGVFFSNPQSRPMGAGRDLFGLRKDGTEFPLEIGLNPVDLDGEPMVLASIIDITARHANERERVQRQRELERSNADLEEVAYIASHDLKEPLRGIANNAKFLREDYAEKLDQEGVSRLLRLGYLCQRMEQLINDLLYFSQLGHQELAVQMTDLNAVIRDIEMMGETMLKEHNATIVIPHELPCIRCDKIRITEVFRNLITNAVKYNDTAMKCVEVGYRDEVKRSEIVERGVFYVKDNGIGIAEEFHEDIFRIFKRLNAEDDDKKGTGVGLTFVRKIVERHGGRIWLDSAPGLGTTFYFTVEHEAGS
jgi:two-component system, LuxR family, sensor kinase FixL